MLWRATPVQQFPARDEVHDLAAGSRGFAEGLPPSGRRGPEVPLTDTVSLSPRISVILHAAGPGGRQEAPFLHTLVFLLTFLTPQGRALAKEFCTPRVRGPRGVPGALPTPSLEA